MNRGFLELDRRSLLGQVLLLAGVAVIPAGCSLSDNNNESDFKFETKQFALLSAFADTLIPKGDTIGALDVAVPKRFEELMRNWASTETREEIVAAMDRLDAAAKRAKGRLFAAAPMADRIAILQAHEPNALKVDEAKAAKVRNISMYAPPPVMDEGYSRMRGLVIKLFYLTEPALSRELSYEHDPNGYKPSIPVSPETRPEGGLSQF